ncbi:uncharacterized protein LOC124664582 [Lolium rigidum]|uniref:uncharacterized protein LOC124664582 n=1 Tax=Lolium rigidum TaxID=89674 RepID=UPI001F5C3AA7|nr:uncharacterized protein LOC124664582 [Lolium rigidum]
MAGEVSKEALESILVHAMFAAKTVRPQRDRLLEVRRRLQQQLKPSDDDIAHCDLASELSKVYYDGMKDSARAIAACLELAAESGARLDLIPAFAAMPDEQLHDALLAQQRLPARPTTQTEAFARVEAAFYAVRLCKEHHILSCIEHLVGVRPPQAAANRSVDVDKARDYLDRACTLASLAVKHIDLAVAVISTFLHPNKVASISEFTDTAASISEDHFLQVTSVFD